MPHPGIRRAAYPDRLVSVLVYAGTQQRGQYRLGGLVRVLCLRAGALGPCETLPRVLSAAAGRGDRDGPAGLFHRDAAYPGAGDDHRLSESLDIVGQWNPLRCEMDGPVGYPRDYRADRPERGVGLLEPAPYLDHQPSIAQCGDPGLCGEPDPWFSRRPGQACPIRRSHGEDGPEGWPDRVAQPGSVVR